MSAAHGTFVLLIDGKANCYASQYNTIINRLNAEYEKTPSADFLITQVVGTVDKPKVPVVHCIYNEQLKD